MGNTGTTRLLMDGDALSAEYDAAGTLLRRYVHGADSAADDPIAWYEGTAFLASNERHLRSDWQGSIVLTAEASNGSVIAVNRYDEYGIPQAGNVGRFGYTGQAYVTELGMYYYKARMYSATLGRFMQTDPIGYKDQINLYAYVGNDPVNEEDFSGLCPACLGAIIGGGIELYDQLGTSEGRAAYVEAGKAIANGDIGGAVRAAGVAVSKVAVSAGAGAVGAGIAARLGTAANAAVRTMAGSATGRVLASTTAQAVGNAAAGAGLGAGGQVAKNALNGNSLGTGVRGATIGGAVGGALGTVAGAAATSRAQNMANVTGNIVSGANGLAAPGSAAGAATGERVGATLGPITERASNPCNFRTNTQC